MNIFEKKMTLIAYLFLRLRSAKSVVRYMCKKSRSRLPFEKEHGKRLSDLLKSEGQHMYHIYWSMETELNHKKSVSVICKILRLFVKILGGVDKSSLPNREYLMQPIQMQVSEKQKTFWQIFSAFFKCSLNFDHCQKKDHPHSWFISEGTACEKRG